MRISVLFSLLAAALLAVPPTAAGHGAGLAKPVESLEASLGGSGQLAPPPALPASAQSFNCQNGFAGPFPCKNVDLESFLPLGGAGTGTGNDVWGWTDPKTGREYALVGSALETTFVDVTDPQNPRNVGSLPASGVADFTLWRDIKVDGNYAFIVSEHSDHGMQVFDLRRLRNASRVPQVFTADAVYRGADDKGQELRPQHRSQRAVGLRVCGREQYVR
jgi:hypothetical protein